MGRFKLAQVSWAECFSTDKHQTRFQTDSRPHRSGLSYSLDSSELVWTLVKKKKVNSRIKKRKKKYSSSDSTHSSSILIDVLDKVEVKLL